MLRTIGPRLEEINAELAALNELRDKPAGTIRISTAGYGADWILWPVLERILHDYPDIKVETTVNYGLIDIVADRYDAGIRIGDQIAKEYFSKKRYRSHQKN